MRQTGVQATSQDDGQCPGRAQRTHRDVAHRPHATCTRSTSVSIAPALAAHRIQGVAEHRIKHIGDLSARSERLHAAAHTHHCATDIEFERQVASSTTRCEMRIVNTSARQKDRKRREFEPAPQPFVEHSASRASSVTCRHGASCDADCKTHDRPGR